MKKNLIKKIFIALTSTAMFVGLASCGGGDDKIDYAHNGSVKLLLPYEGKNFFVHGIGEVTVKTYIDGDTTHFQNVSGDTATVLKSRYFGIDTPESTGNIQPYGKQASNFTKEKLMNAAEHGTIVVSSPFSVNLDGSMGVYGAPEADSTGSRYMSLVWIHETKRHAPVGELSLLNLWIVQEGLSWARITDEDPFHETFYKAEKQAEKLKLKMWSGKDDPYFNYGDYQTTTLKEIKDEIVEYLKDETHTHENLFNGAKVRFKGVVAGYNGNKHMMYVQERYIVDKEGNPVSEDEYDPEHPELYEVEWAGINIFTGTSPIDTLYQQVGAYIEVVGTCIDSETFGFQISDTQGKWLTDTKEDEDFCRILLKAEDNDGEHALQTFEYTVDELNNLVAHPNYENLYCRTKINADLVCEDAYIADSGTEMTLYFKGCDFDVYAPFLYRGNPDDTTDSWMHKDRVIGKTFRVSGVYGYHLTGSGNLKYQVIACDEDDLVCITPKEGTVPEEGYPYTVSEAVSNAATAIPDVRYFATGKIDTLEPIDSAQYDSYTPAKQLITVKRALEIIDALGDGKTTTEEYCLKGEISSVDYAWDATKSQGTYTLSQDGESSGEVYKISLYNIGAAAEVEGASIGVGSKVYVQGKLKKFVKEASTSPEVVNGKVVAHYTDRSRTFTLKEGGDILYVENAYVEDLPDRVQVGSTLRIIGVPTIKDNKVYYESARVLAAQLHGQHAADPLTVAEANTVAGALESRERTNELYYIVGTVKEIVFAYNTKPDTWHDSNNKVTAGNKIGFTIEDNGQEFLIWGAMMDIIGYDVDPATGAKTAIYVDYTKIVPGARVLAGGKLMKNQDGVLSTYQNGSKVFGIFE